MRLRIRLVTFEQSLILRIGRCGKPSFSSIREAIAGYDQTVVDVPRSTDDIAGFWILLDGILRIVRGRIEYGHVAPQTIVRLHDAVANTVFKFKLLRDLPTVLQKELEHIAAVWRVAARSEFRIRVE